MGGLVIGGAVGGLVVGAGDAANGTTLGGTVGGLLTGGAERKAAPPQRWLPSFESLCREVEEEDLGRILNRASADARRGVRPTPKKERPTFIVLFGAPGSGKTTIAAGLGKAAELRSGQRYAVVDYDALDKYYPYYRDLTNIPAFAGRKRLGVGFIHAHMCPALNTFVMALGDALVEDLIRRRMNIAVVSHRPSFLVQARLSGYRSVFVYVGVPTGVAAKRARQRALETGFLLAETLEAQDGYVQAMWEEYVRLAPWYALWAERFIAVDNGPERKEGCRTVPLKEAVFCVEQLGEGNDIPSRLESRLTKLYRQVANVSGINPKDTRLLTLVSVGKFLSTKGISPGSRQSLKNRSTPPAGGRVYGRVYRGGAGSDASDAQAASSDASDNTGSADDICGSCADDAVRKGKVVPGNVSVVAENAGTFRLRCLGNNPKHAEDEARRISAAGDNVAAIVFDRADDLPPTGPEIALAFGVCGAVYARGEGWGGVWRVLPGDIRRTPCLASAVCRDLLTRLPWAERLHVLGCLAGNAGAYLKEAYPQKAAELNLSAAFVG